MEEQITTTPQPTTPTLSPKPKKDPFSMIGKILIILIVIALLLGGGIILGKNMNKTQNKSTTTTEDKKIESAGPAMEESTPITSTPAPTMTNLKSFNGGLGTDQTSFKPYILESSAEWTSSEEKTDITHKLTLTKGQYSISIYQAPMGGSMCIYPGDAEGNFKQMYQKYSEFKGASGETYRRSWNEKAGTITYTICSKSQDGTFGTFTTFGGVTVTAPNPPDEATLSEIDTIIASIKLNP